MKFTHLHVHSHYSLLDGLAKIDQLVKRAGDLGFDALALTDHGVLYGAIEFYQKARRAGIKPIIGCLPPGHLLHTDRGAKPIEEIAVGDLVLTHRGRFRRVLRTMTRHHRGKIYGVRAASANTVWMTEEHPVLVAANEREEPKWVRADALTAGRRNRHGGARAWKSYALLPKLREGTDTTLHLLAYLDRKIYNRGSGNSIAKTGKYTKYDALAPTAVPAELPINSATAQLFGVFLAEGSYQHDPKGRPTALVLSFGDHEDALVNATARTLTAITQSPARIRHRPERHLKEIYVGNTVLARAFINLCGKSAGGKHIPSPVFRWSSERLRDFLNGLIAGDGRIHPTGQVSLRLKSRDLAWGARLIAVTLGYPAKVAAARYDGKEVNTVAWNPTGKYKRVLESDAHLFLPIKEILVRDYDGPVYNLEIEEDNSYVGDLALHNCEFYIAAEGMADKRPGIDDKRSHLTVLAANAVGYQNLIQLATKAHLEGFYYKPRVDKAALREHASGLIVLSGCLNSEISKAILSKRPERAETLIREHQDMFGRENFYLELGAHPAIPEQKIVNDALIGLSEKTGAPIAGVNDVHYARPDDREAQDILVSVQTGNRIDDENRLTMKADDLSMKSTQEMAEFFRDHPLAIGNTHEIAERTNLEIPLGNIRLPRFPLPAGTTAEKHLEELARHGLARRYGQAAGANADPAAKKIEERLAYELNVIGQTGFASYFLIVQDFVNWARKNGIVVGPGRGSAAGSLVSYLLGITNIDPLAYNLLFERFLNPERIAMPDIDLDFSDRRRDEVIEYVAQKYGRDRVAQIITFGTMAARAAIRDTGRALNMPYTFCDQVAKLIPFNPTQGMKEGWLAHCLENVTEFRELYQSRTDAKRLIDAAMKLEGVARHASTHACGVVITPEALTNYVPLQLATRPHRGEARPAEGWAARTGPKLPTSINGNGENEKVVVTQYEMHAIEDLGLLKMDFLGLRNLTIIEDTVKLIRANHQTDIDIDTIPLDDQKTFRVFREGKTNGVFQFESSGMKRYLKELRPSALEDLIAMVSLYRPGPIELIPSFIARKHGHERITYLHEKLKPILAPTHGIGVYQEQMMQIARDLAGYTLPEADTLRKAIGKKIKSLLEEQRGKLLAGMRKNGIDQKTAQAIWELFPPFARYGFNRSHAACYALISYQTAYLKAHWPAEFMASIMTAEGFEIERVGFLVEEARSLGIAILPPSVNESNATFTVVSPKEIRFGLGSVKNVGTNVVAAIVAAREARLPDGQAGGAFTSLDDLVERVQSKDLNKKSMESLMKCGAFDGFGERGALLANMDRMLEYARDIQRTRSAGQTSLFALPTFPSGTLGGQGGADAGPRAAIRLEPAPPAEKKDRLSWEKELLGLYVSEHPFEEYRERLAGKTTAVARLGEHTRDAVVSVAGLVSSVDRIVTKAGTPMLFVKLEDLTGKAEVLVFPRVLEKTAALWQPDKVLLVTGRLSRDRDEPKVLADEVIEVS